MENGRVPFVRRSAGVNRTRAPALPEARDAHWRRARTGPILPAPTALCGRRQFPGALRILRELALAGPVGPGNWHPPTSVGSRDAVLHRLSRLATLAGRLRPGNPPDGTMDKKSADKAAIRASSLARRDALTEYHRARAAQMLAEHAGTLGIWPGAIVSGFWPIRSEIDPRPLMDALARRGAVIALPAVIDRQTIVFRRHDPDAALVAGGFGTMAPGPDAQTLDPDLMLVPLSAFDDAGNRIGYGAGHYDRAIARLHASGRPPRLVGLAFECQRVDRVPAEPHDVPLHTVLTENGLQALAAQR